MKEEQEQTTGAQAGSEETAQEEQSPVVLSEEDAAKQYDTAWEDEEGDDDKVKSLTGEDDDDPEAALKPPATEAEPTAEELAAQRETEEATKATEQEATEKEQADWWKRVESIHPNAEEVLTNDPRLKPWLAKQSEEVRKAAENAGDPDNAIRVLTVYRDALAAGKVEELPRPKISAVDVKETLSRLGVYDQPITDVKGNETTMGALLTEQLGADMTQALLTALEARVSSQGTNTQALISQAVQQALKEAGVASSSDVSAIREQVIANELRGAVQDYDKIVTSDPFKKYVEGVEAPMKKLWASTNAGDRATFLNNYRRTHVAEVIQMTKAAQGKRVQNKQALHKSILRGGADERPTKPATGDAVAEFDEGWNEDDE